MLRKGKRLNGSTLVPVFYVNNLIKYFELDNLNCWLYFCVLLGDYDLELGCDNAYMRDNNIKNNFELIEHLRDSNQIKIIRSRYNEKKLKIVDDLVGMFNFTFTNYNLFFSSDKDSYLVDDMDRFLLSVGDLSTSWLKCEVEDTSEETVYSICINNGILKDVYNRLNSTRNIVEYSRYKKPQPERVFKTIEYPKNDENEKNIILDYIKKVNQQKPDDESDNLKLFLCSMAVWFKWLNTNKYEKSVEEPAYLFADAFFYNFIILKLKNLLEISTGKNIFPNIDRLTKILCEQLDTDQKPYQDIVDLYLSINKSYISKIPQYFERDLKYVHRVNEFQSLYFTVGAYAKLEKLRLKWLCPDEFLNCFFICKYIQDFGKKETNIFALNCLLIVSYQYFKKLLAY